MINKSSSPSERNVPDSFGMPDSKEPYTSLPKKKEVNRWKWVALSLLLVLLVVQLGNIPIIPPLLFQGRTVVELYGEWQDGKLQEIVLPEEGVNLSFSWGDFGQQLVDNGTIDKEKMEELYASRGSLREVDRQILFGEDDANLHIGLDNADIMLNALWAFGLANSNPVLAEGPIQDPDYGGAENFAATGGWTLSQGDPMDHFAKYPMVTLTDDQQSLVENVAKGIFRPCCGNSVYFPDCNHGMAMLGLLELMAANDYSEQEMYDTALLVNSYWYPDTYVTIAKYFENRGVEWSDVDSQVVLSSAYSGASGYQQILAEVQPVTPQGGASCGV